jgi:hypothetical protein
MIVPRFCPESGKKFLPRSQNTYGCEVEGMDLDAEGGDVLLLKLTSQVALDKGRL